MALSRVQRITTAAPVPTEFPIYMTSSLTLYTIPNQTVPVRSSHLYVRHHPHFIPVTPGWRPGAGLTWHHKTCQLGGTKHILMSQF